MIKEIRDKEPFIHFGFNRQTIIARVGIPIILWQDTIFKSDEYTDPFILAPSAYITKVSVNKYELNFTTLGDKTCKFSTTGTDAKFLESNEIVASVQAITWGAKDIFLNNETITFSAI